MDAGCFIVPWSSETKAAQRSMNRGATAGAGGRQRPPVRCFWGSSGGNSRCWSCSLVMASASAMIRAGRGRFELLGSFVAATSILRYRRSMQIRAARQPRRHQLLGSGDRYHEGRAGPCGYQYIHRGLSQPMA